MRFVVVVSMTIAIVRAEMPPADSCRHCEADVSDAGRLVPACADGNASTDRYCRWVVRYERTGAKRQVKTNDQIAVENALGKFRLVQPVQVAGDEASALVTGNVDEFKVVFARKSSNGWQIVMIMDAPESQSKLSMHQK